MKCIADSIKAIDGAKSVSGLRQCLKGFITQLGFDHFLVGVSHAHSMTQTEVWYVMSCNSFWQRNVLCELSTQPTARQLKKHYELSPSVWNNLRLESSECTLPHCLNGCVTSDAIRSAMSLPIHMEGSGFGVILLLGRDANAHMRWVDIGQLAHEFIPSLRRAVTRLAFTREVRLTVREKETLTWAAEGKSAWEISQIVGCSERTVAFHLSNAALKLDAINRYQAITKALLQGVISP